MKRIMNEEICHSPRNMISCLDSVSRLFPDNIVIADEYDEFSYQRMMINVRSIASTLAAYRYRNKPVVLLLDRGTACIMAMIGVVFSGNFYVVADTEMPSGRIKKIMDNLLPCAIITDFPHQKLTQNLAGTVPVILYEDAVCESIDMDLLNMIQKNVIDTDPVYALYTSGSTGQPKGTLVSHRAVLSYTEWYINAFDISEETVFGSQTPLYFSMSVSDLYSALRTGGRYQLIPKRLFSFPGDLINYLNQYQINTIYWVPSALAIVAHWDVFSYIKPAYLKKVLFAGEAMPVKQLNYWRKHFPNLLYANLFGPTETTDICCYYIVDREFTNDESLPIGRPCDNCDILIVDENGQAADRGELLVRGSFLADGYYRDEERTMEAFIQNPLNKEYPEKVYRTGDLVLRDKNGELIYLGRKDYQIKHMGYRIELGEIEAAVGALEGIKAGVCLYDKSRERILLVYEGKIGGELLARQLKEHLPAYMWPGKYMHLKQMPYNANGKIDRAKLFDTYVNI